MLGWWWRGSGRGTGRGRSDAAVFDGSSRAAALGFVIAFAREKTGTRLLHSMGNVYFCP